MIAIGVVTIHLFDPLSHIPRLYLSAKFFKRRMTGILYIWSRFVFAGLTANLCSAYVIIGSLIGSLRSLFTKRFFYYFARINNDL
jgi:hypothetical protein